MSILLPLSSLRARRACDLPNRIEAFTAHHGCAPGEGTTFLAWAEVTPDFGDLIWALRCVPASEGKRIAVSVAVKAARRALRTFEVRFPDDKRPRAAIEAAERWLKAPNAVNASLASHAAALARSAAYAAYAAANAAYAAAYAADAAYAAAYAADAAYAAANAANAANANAAANAAYAAYAAERAAQRADLLALISEVKCP